MGAEDCRWRRLQVHTGDALPFSHLSSSPPLTSLQFCLAYKRTTEFRRLCDIVRNHLANLLK